jgi:hypothetical protein
MHQTLILISLRIILTAGAAILSAYLRAKKKAVNQYCSFFHSLWGKYAREKQDIKMLNEMNNTSWVWPDNINW